MMSKEIRIAVDAMGGDHGPGVVIPGSAKALLQCPSIRYTFFGDESLVAPLIARWPTLAERSTIVHTSVSVSMGDKPSQALRRGRRVSSMWMAIESVKRGEADAAVSAGNTGALMAMAKVCLNTVAEVDRPAIGCIWPTLRGKSIVLDVGATVGGNETNLVQNAIMGAAMARIVLDLSNPTIGLLNVGVEEVKGNEEVKAAGRLLSEGNLPGFSYAGFIEGDGIAKGEADVVVTDGFTGNIALKSSEGSLRQFAQVLRESMTESLGGKLGYLLARRAFARVRDRMDPRQSNGGVLLGLNGLVIKSHGGADVASFAVAVELAHKMARKDLLSEVREALFAAHAPSADPVAIGVAASM